jgi:hypothetical protein
MQMHMAQPNIHSPQRADGESFDDYRKRRAASKVAVREMTRAPMQPPSIGQFDVSRFFLGQHTNSERGAKRKERRAAKRAIAATGQQPKLIEPRERKQHKHPKDERGNAITLIGRNNTIRDGKQLVGWYENERRIWLGGISAQRGY